MTKKLLCSMLIAVLLVTSLFVGCKKDNNIAETDDKKVTGSTESTKTEDNQQKSPVEGEDNLLAFEKYDEPITITHILGFSPVSTAPDGITPENQNWIDMVKETLNINIEYKWIVPSEQFEQKLGVAFATDDLPDILSVNERQYQELKENGQLMDISSMVDKYVSKKFKEALYRNPAVVEALTTKDGELYAIPKYEDNRMQLPMLWIRQDWLDQLGLELPTSFQDLENIAKAFVEQDPDGNGKNDTFGFPLSKDIKSWIYDTAMIMPAFNAYLDGWIPDDSGKLTATDIKPEVKTALEWFNKAYEEGLIDPEFMTKDQAQVKEDCINNKYGLFLLPWWAPDYPLTEILQSNPDQKWSILQLPSMEGAPSKVMTKRIRTNNYIVVSKNCENPEAAIKMINLFMELATLYPERSKPENGFVWNWVTTQYFDSEEMNQNYMNMQEAVKTGNTDIILETTRLPKEVVLTQYENYNDITSWFNGEIPWNTDPESQYGTILARLHHEGGWAMARKIAEDGNILYSEFYGAATPTMTEKGSTLKKLRDEMFLKIIVGEEPIDKFEDFVQSWKKLGGDQITKEVNEWYEKNKK